MRHSTTVVCGCGRIKREADVFLWEELSVPLLIVILKIVGKMNFLELVKARHSVRSYVERPIEQSKLDYILECVRLAPSAVNGST